MQSFYPLYGITLIKSIYEWPAFHTISATRIRQMAQVKKCCTVQDGSSATKEQSRKKAMGTMALELLYNQKTTKDQSLSI